jgi:hypothetical protein
MGVFYEIYFKETNMPTESSIDRVISLALSNPKFRSQLLDPKVDNSELLRKYGIEPTPELVSLNKDRLADLIKARLDAVGWCVGNACGLGT